MPGNLPQRPEAISKKSSIAKGIFLLIVFSKSNSQSFAAAVNIAEGADFFEKSSDEKNFICGFKKSKRSLEKAHVLLKYISGWKSTNCFIGNKKRPGWKTHLWIECYLTALDCENKKAHCYTATDVVGGGITVASCKLAVNHACFEYGSYDSATLESKKQFIKMKVNFEDQLQAWAVNTGCDICPLFHPLVEITERKQIGARNEDEIIDVKKND